MLIGLLIGIVVKIGFFKTQQNPKSIRFVESITNFVKQIREHATAHIVHDHRTRWLTVGV